MAQPIQSERLKRLRERATDLHEKAFNAMVSCGEDISPHDDGAARFAQAERNIYSGFVNASAVMFQFLDEAQKKEVCTDGLILAIEITMANREREWDNITGLLNDRKNH